MFSVFKLFSVLKNTLPLSSICCFKASYKSDKPSPCSAENGIMVSKPKELLSVKPTRPFDPSHLFTKTNPVRARRKYAPTLEIENFGLTQSDFDTVFNAGEILGIGTQTLREIVSHLEKIYCESIGVEYMYIRKPEEIQWIQDKLNINA